jgi:hypothetical protein
MRKAALRGLASAGDLAQGLFRGSAFPPVESVLGESRIRK